ncbi:hypothetical protein PR202_gb09640 [Eleusine coracana subsp. coracana]|uniref:Uncharacterized protein n=1 Tax=Eleusine coracana subsp. coracana TaxID=191504 RepID=A0AAV5EG40_ELECO|nr:hypothetical protein PR202_gb09640 [Eleusine coracana subsp. coracana]
MCSCGPTKRIQGKRMLRLLPPRHHLLQLLTSLQNQSPLPERCSHQSPEMSSANSTNGCWKRSGRSSLAMLQRRRNLMRRRPFSRSSSELNPSRACKLTSCHSDLVSGVSPGMWLSLIGFVTSPLLYYLVN